VNKDGIFIGTSFDFKVSWSWFYFTFNFADCGFLIQPIPQLYGLCEYVFMNSIDIILTQLIVCA